MPQEGFAALVESVPQLFRRDEQLPGDYSSCGTAATSGLCTPGGWLGRLCPTACGVCKPGGGGDSRHHIGRTLKEHNIDPQAGYQPRCTPLMESSLVIHSDQYPLQSVLGPIQTDEAALLHSLVRVTGTKRVLELGGLAGFSARVFTDAVRCQDPRLRRVYTVDLRPVRSVEPSTHTAILKDATLLTLADIEHKPIDLLFLDCHSYNATRHTVTHLLAERMLTDGALVVLHDTGRNHNTDLYWAKDGIHQPVERLIAQWMSNELEGQWQRVSFHDDRRVLGGRHGLTVMQRRHDLAVPCTGWKRFFDISEEDCIRVQQGS